MGAHSVTKLQTCRGQDRALVETEDIVPGGPTGCEHCSNCNISIYNYSYSVTVNWKIIYVVEHFPLYFPHDLISFWKLCRTPWKMLQLASNCHLRLRSSLFFCGFSSKSSIPYTLHPLWPSHSATTASGSTWGNEWLLPARGSFTAFSVCLSLSLSQSKSMFHTEAYSHKKASLYASMSWGVTRPWFLAEKVKYFSFIWDR